MLLIPVHGTFTVPATGTVWFQRDSDVHRAMVWAGYDYVKPDDPFSWSGDLDGAFAGKRSQTDWEAAGRSLRYYMQDVPYANRNILAHSHGLQVALFAAAQGVKFRRLISIGGPVRTDMAAIAKRGRKNLGPWLAVYSPWDLVQIVGGICIDFTPEIPKQKQPLANVNLAIPRVGHSGLLSDTRHIPTLIREVLPWTLPSV